MARGNGLDDLSRRLKRIPEEVRKAIDPAVTQSAEEMAATMRAMVPVKSGKLRESIVVTPPGGTTPAHSQPGGSHVVPAGAAVVTAGNSEVRYAHLVEYGHMASGWSDVPAPAYPFFWPGYRLTKKRARGRINRAMKKAIERGWSS
ncbi:hypothetical protein GCM10008171_19600 [Methylopila jiangsuensis]|uniref:HK97 gp10 family phage protein n=1 Tax=Methylopila jiangsuensis TaxID=586230 RepID=A0A9W6N3Y0_9HYPH|nr:HK97 gp10 family phage protein [Methylopila jiangsuensis]MDR6286944.1 HK97 gp10 family phage protein [Methylopila jiangsuensis]GLK76706.1 hypothetical protein GCM10008171_19600 [Methylopila jiangsuensis]